MHILLKYLYCVIYKLSSFFLKNKNKNRQVLKIIHKNKKIKEIFSYQYIDVFIPFTIISV